MSSSLRLKSFTDPYPYLGPAIWFATLEYFVIQYVVASSWPTPYSLLRNQIVISATQVAASTTEGRSVLLDTS